MDPISVLKINGQSFEITDKKARELLESFTINQGPSVRYDIEQSLSNAQQVQARENIGALGHTITKPVRMSNGDQDAVIFTAQTISNQDDLLVDVLTLQGDREGQIDSDSVVLRGLHEGIEDSDAVNKKQLDDAIADKTVRYDVDQNLEEVQQAQARKNIGAVGYTAEHILDMNGHSIQRVSSIVVGEPGVNKAEASIFPYRDDDGYEGLELLDSEGGQARLGNIRDGVKDKDAVNVKQLKDAEVRMVDRLCPPFTESGVAVTCEPVEGYPLAVEWQSKNLFNYKDWVAFAKAANNNSSNARESVTYLERECFSYPLYRQDTNVFFTDIQFKPNTQYTFKMQAAVDSTYKSTWISAIAIIYEDGTQSSYVSGTCYDDHFVEMGITSEVGKTIKHLAITRNDPYLALYVPIDSCVIMEGTTAEYVPYVETATITRCGQNLFDYKKWVAFAKAANNNSSSARENVSYLERECFSYPLYRRDTNVYFTDIRFKPNTQYTFKMQVAAPDLDESTNLAKTMTIIYEDGSQSSYLQTRVYADRFVEVAVTSEVGKTIKHLAITRHGVPTAVAYVPIDSCVIMEGTTAEYVPYIGETFAQDEQIPAISGVNNLWADSGDITVSGREDLYTKVKRLENAILSMGANA